MSNSTKPWTSQGLHSDMTFINLNVVDVEASKIMPNCTVRVKDGLIADVATGDPSNVPQESKVVDLQNKYICPSLIDCHVHLTATPGSAALKDLYTASPNTIAYRTAYVAREMLLRGFTTARNTGGADAALREAIAEGLIPGPRLFIAGKALSDRWARRFPCQLPGKWA